MHTVTEGQCHMTTMVSGDLLVKGGGVDGRGVGVKWDSVGETVGWEWQGVNCQQKWEVGF